MAGRIKPKQKVTINPLTGDFDIITDNNFSYESVPSGKKLEIPENMQMAVHDEFILDGDLDLEGSLILED